MHEYGSGGRDVKRRSVVLGDLTAADSEDDFEEEEIGESSAVPAGFCPLQLISSWTEPRHDDAAKNHCYSAPFWCRGG